MVGGRFDWFCGFVVFRIVLELGGIAFAVFFGAC